MEKAGRVLLLAQNTRFCRYTAGRAAASFRDKVLCDTVSSLAEGRRKAEGTVPVILIWGDGKQHQLSNALNIPSSLKYVFDNHDDNDDGRFPDFDSHNSFSTEEGVLVRVCRSITHGVNYSVYNEGQDNGLLHISMDLDFLEGFPAIQWMSVGSGTIEKMLEYAETLARWKKLVRLDMGGFRDTDEKEIETVYKQYYEPVIVRLLPLMDSSEPQNNE